MKIPARPCIGFGKAGGAAAHDAPENRLDVLQPWKIRKRGLTATAATVRAMRPFFHTGFAP